MSISRKRRRARVQKKSHIWNLRKLELPLVAAAIAACEVGTSIAILDGPFLGAAKELRELMGPPAANEVEK